MIDRKYNLHVFLWIWWTIGGVGTIHDNCVAHVVSAECVNRQWFANMFIGKSVVYQHCPKTNNTIEHRIKYNGMK